MSELKETPISTRAPGALDASMDVPKPQFHRSVAHDCQLGNFVTWCCVPKGGLNHDDSPVSKDCGYGLSTVILALSFKFEFVAGRLPPDSPIFGGRWDDSSTGAHPGSKGRVPCICRGRSGRWSSGRVALRGRTASLLGGGGGGGSGSGDEPPKHRPSRGPGLLEASLAAGGAPTSKWRRPPGELG